MRTRDFIAALSTTAIWPLAPRAQQPANVKRIAMVHPAEKASNMNIAGHASLIRRPQVRARLRALAPRREALLARRVFVGGGEACLAISSSTFAAIRICSTSGRIRISRDP